MKSQTSLYRILVFCISLVATAWLLQMLFYSVTAIRYVVFSCDAQMSGTFSDTIKKQITLFESNGIYNPDAIIEKMPTYFPAIKSIEVEQLPPHVALVTIKLFDPIVRINDDQLLVENQSILLSDYYAPYKVESLQKITIAAPVPSCVSPSIMAALNQCLAQEVFDHYTLHMVNEHEWYCKDAQDPLFTLCCNSSSLPIDVLRGAYNRLKNKIKQRGPAKTKWIADIRFQDQIILSMDKGGRYG